MPLPSAQAAFGQPFPEQVAFFLRKVGIPTARWDDLRTAQHDHAWVVAGAMQADLLNDLHEAVTAAINEGLGIAEFRRAFRDIVARNGWQGWTGADSQAGFTWRYVHADGVASPRPQHLAWGQQRLTLRHDHPFWQTHYPPNGFGCHCYVIAVRNPEAGDATVPPVGWDTVSASTGQLPGIDKGWGYAPGATAADPLGLARVVADKSRGLPFQLAADFLAEIKRGVEPGLWAQIETQLGAL